MDEKLKATIEELLQKGLAKTQEEAEKKAKELITLEVKEAKEKAEAAEKKAQELEEKLKTAEENAKKQQEHLDALDVKLQKQGGRGKNVKSLTEVIEEHKESIQNSVKSKGQEFEFEVKADTLRASVVGNPDALDIRDVGQLAHRKLMLYDLFAKVSVGPGSNGVIRYTDWDEATTVRAAAMVAEGAAFPESTAKWKTYTLDLKKIGDTIPMSEELIYDAPRFADELRLFLETNVAIKRENQLYSGDNTGNNINGIVNSVDAYVPVNSGIQDASIYDLIVKVSEDITKDKGSRFSPDFLIMNISDINKMKLKKDKNDNYVMPPFVDRNGQVVDGKLVVECNEVVANTFVIGDKRYARIYEIPGVSVATGLGTGDFESDMQTLKARHRLAFLIRNCDKPGFRKVTSISAALTTLATA